MHHVTGIALENVVNIQEAFIPFEEKFVVVTGHNKDSKISSTQNNASGKSTAFSALPNVLFESDPMSAKKDRKALLGSTDSKIQVDFTSANGDKLVALQTPTKYYMSDGEQDLKAAKIADAKELIQSHFPISEAEFYSYCFVNGNKPFEFQHNSPDQRFNFLAKLFRLDVYDQVRAHVKKLRDQASKSQVQYDAIQENLIFLQKKLGDNEWKKGDDKKLTKLEKDLRKMEEKSQELYTQLAEMDANAQYSDSRSKYLSQRADALEVLGKPVTNKRLKQWKELREQIDDYEDYKERLQEYQEAMRDVERSLEKIGDSGSGVDTEDLRKEFAKLAKEEEKLEEMIETSLRNKKKLERLKEKEASLKLRVFQLDDIDSKQLSKELNNLEQVVELAEELSDHSDCPTCGQAINGKKLKKQAKDAQKKITAIEKKLELADAQSELLTVLSEIGELEIHNVPKLKKKLKKVTKRIEEIERIGSNASKYQKLVAKKNALKKPKKVEKPKLVKNLDKKIKAAQKQLKADEYLKELPEIDFDKKKYKALKKEKDALSKKYNKARPMVVKLSVHKTEYTSLTEQIDNAKDQAAKLQDMVDNKKVLDNLFKLYGKELKSVAINDRLAALETVMNENAYLVYSEPMKFSFRADENKIIAQVKRGNGMTSDISKMSGSESNCFRLLFAYSLLPIIPSERRTNFMILDEPDAACDPEVRYHIIKNFVPHLRQSVPSVFWITPKDVGDFDACDHWRVVKENGISQIYRLTK